MASSATEGGSLLSNSMSGSWGGVGHSLLRYDLGVLSGEG